MKVVQSSVFRVPAGSKTEAAIIEHNRKTMDAKKAWSDFAEKHGAKQLYCSTKLSGLVFDGDRPDGWVRAKKGVNAFRPSLKRPLSDEAKEFKSLPVSPSMIDWLYALELDVMPNSSGRFKSPGYCKIDETLYLTAADGCPIPDDVVQATPEEAERVNNR